MENKPTPEISQIHNSEEILLELYNRGVLSQKDHDWIRDSIREDHQEAITLARKEGEEKLKEIREELKLELYRFPDALLKSLSLIDKHLTGEQKGEKDERPM